MILQYTKGTESMRKENGYESVRTKVSCGNGERY